MRRAACLAFAALSMAASAGARESAQRQASQPAASEAGADSQSKQPAAAVDPDESSLQTRRFRPPEVGSTAHWDILRIPELATRLALTPLFPLITAAEQVRLDLRIYDLVTNPERTRLILPLVTAYTKDGIGAGLLYAHSDAFGGGENIEFYALTTTNRDVELSGSYSEDVALLDGRSLGTRFEYELDKNERYYGIGPRTRQEDLRALEFRNLSVSLEFDIGGPNTYFTTGFGSVGRIEYLRERLGPGRISGAPPVSQDDAVVPAPAGFEEPLDYANASWRFSFDQRDADGRTQKGVYLVSDLSASQNVNGADLSSGKAVIGGSYFVPLAPRYRVLVLTAAGAVTTPLGEDDQIPLHQLVTLGRGTNVRGYPQRRFRERSGWWATVEYRYPIFDFEDSGAGLSAALFFDVGGVARSLPKWFQSPVRYSPGIGIRAEAPSDFVFRAQIAHSEEGIEAGISLNELYEF